MIYAHSWLTFFDHAQQQVARSQIYNLYAYLPFAFVTSHLMLAGNSRAKIAYPTMQAEVRARTTKATNLMATMISEMSPSARVFASTRNLVSTYYSIRSHDRLHMRAFSSSILSQDRFPINANIALCYPCRFSIFSPTCSRSSSRA